MKLRILAVLLAVIVVLVPGTAYAKGPGEATIEGPGLTEPIHLGAPGQFSEDAMELANAAGFWQVQIQGEPDPLVEPTPPAGDLGPRYDAVIEFGGPGGIHMQLYPFADAGPYAYTPGGQTYFDTVAGTGWYRADARLQNALVHLGAPVPQPAAPADLTPPAAQRPTTTDAGRGPLTAVVIVAATALTALGALIALSRFGPIRIPARVRTRRRRPAAVSR